ncbi:MAG TPA: TIGR03943 family protein [Actinomycetota bacterium]|nr:TIGR03943 family protein [Actinomycetota bacterium]
MTAAGGLISLLVGTVLLRLVLTGTYGRYVRLGMGPWLLVAGVAVIALGVITLLRALRHAHAPDAHDHHRHGGGDRVGWLLLAPIAALLLVAPPTLGSYGVGRGAKVDIRAGAGVLDPLVAGAEPTRMTLLEYGQRAFDRDGASFGGAAVQLTGFVAGAEEDGFRLARYQIACCAADAAPVVVRVVGSRRVPARDRWVTVTGVFRPGGDEVPELAATNVVEVPAPDDPYE